MNPMDAKDAMQEALHLWAEFSVDKLTDTTYWWGWFSAWAAILTVMFIIVLPAILRSGTAPIASLYLRRMTDYYWVWTGKYRDAISIAKHIFWRCPITERLMFCLDYDFNGKTSELIKNKHNEFSFIRTADNSCPEYPLIRKTPYGPKKRPLWKRLFRVKLRAKDFKRLRVEIIHWYEAQYEAILAYTASENNPLTTKAMAGVPFVLETGIMAKTFFADPEARHRIHVFDKDTFVNWPTELEEPVYTPINIGGTLASFNGTPHYHLPPGRKKTHRIAGDMAKHQKLMRRFDLSAWLSEQYKIYPWRFHEQNVWLTPDEVRQRAENPLFPTKA